MSNVSGKLVMIAIVAVAMAAAGTSWWFRYSATHRAAEFWGNAAVLIRDAPSVQLLKSDSPFSLELPSDSVDDRLEAASTHNISDARGLVHLRNALLDDRSFHWPPRTNDGEIHWQWFLIFQDPATGKEATLLFSLDWKFTTVPAPSRQILSCEPIAAGLAAMLAEHSTSSADAAR